jgi:DNA-binding NtrC family response regulator/tetratricopeptide (TPR) repeat protein
MSTSPTPQVQPAIIAGRYAIVRKLGAGSVGTVYLVFDQVERREVALKLLRTEALIARSAARIQEEFRAIAALEHPQIAKAHDFGYSERDGVPYYTREHVEGRPLPPGPPASQTPEEYLRPVLDLLDALEYVHDQGILHLDVHAGNLIVANDSSRGSVLIDFGLAPSPASLVGSARGASLLNLPPELIAGKEPRPATDLYLVGRLLLYRITGRTTREPNLPREIPGWGARRTLELERILHKALEADPDKRFGSAADLRAALSRAIGSTLARRGWLEPRRMLLGRESEVSDIDAALRCALEGSPATLWITGSSGMGKSSLLREARLRAQLRGLEAVTVEFPAESTPGLLRAIQRLGRKHRSLVAWLEFLAPRCGGTPRERAQRAAGAYFLERESPLALLLDNVHLADGESKLLIEALARECERRRASQTPGRGLALVLSQITNPGRHGSGGHVCELRGLPAVNARKLFQLFTRPLDPPSALVRSAVASARGSPFLLRQLASVVREAWRENRVFPTAEELAAPAAGPRGLIDWRRLPDEHRRVLTALALLRRPALLAELAAAAGISARVAARSLRRLDSLQCISHRGQGTSRRFRLDAAELAEELARGAPPTLARGIHERIVALISGRRRTAKHDLEDLALHLLALGRWQEGAARAVEAAHRLRAGGSRDRACYLLDRALSGTLEKRARLEVVELLSEILDELGDHQRGISIIAPIFQGSVTDLSRGERVRLGRRLGVHFHRAGLPAEALAVFESVRGTMDPSSDFEEVIRIESEVAELEIFRGNLPAAEEACRRGLAQVGAFKARTGFLGKMEVMLRASLGHLELRRFNFSRAKSELRRALTLSRKFGSAGDRAAILQNLGVALNESNDLPGARRRFEEAARLLKKAGDRQDLIKVSNNLALISAKLGDAEAADFHLDQAASLSRHFPVRRLECFTAYSRGLSRLLLGRCEEAFSSLEDAAARSHDLGDGTMEAFAAVFAGEAALFTGRYEKAQEFLKRAARLDRVGLPVLRRMVSSRLYLLWAVLGEVERARRSLVRFRAAPRSGVAYLEAWNDLFLALGQLAGGRAAAEVFERSLRVFHEFGIVSGERLCRLGLVFGAIAARDGAGLREQSRQIMNGGATPHRFLQVAEPLALAEASLAVGEIEAAGAQLSVASSAIVGSPFVEADWRLELLRARVAAKAGELAESRRHLHRALHCRNLLVQLIPGRCRETFLAHPRFQGLREAEGTLGSTAVRTPGRERRSRSRGLEGLLGQSPAMELLFQTLERLREQDLPVLILGETGTGKELVAQALHRNSPRREKPFQVVHCACLPNDLFESELFGHVAGAFTGAERDQVGILEAAAGGTVLLDDLHLLPPQSQAKLVGVVQSMSIRKLGSASATPIDVRFLATSSADLRLAVREGRFHEGLFFRLAGVVVQVPPLRDRSGDIGLLARHFVERHALRLDRPVPLLEEKAVACLEICQWPGNVRELESVLLRAMVLQSRPDRITAGDLESLLEPQEERSIPSGKPLLARGLDDWRQDLERSYLTELLLELRADIPAAAKRLGVRRSKLYDWCRRLGIDIRTLRRGL